MPLRLAFMGTPDFAAPTLGELVGQGHQIAAVYSQPARPKGRGLAAELSPVAKLAEAYDLPLRMPASLKDAAEQQAFAELEVDAAIVVAYGLLLPKAVLDAPRLGCFNLHGSLLPRWRGAAPIQRAIMAGDDETGVMVMRMEEGLDTGPVLMAERVDVGRKTYGELHDELSRLGADLMARALAALERGSIAERPQPETGATYARKIAKGEARIDWSKPARRDRLPDPRAVAGAGRLVRGQGRAAEDSLCRAGRGPWRGGRNPGRCADSGLRRRRVVRSGACSALGAGRWMRPSLLRGFALPAGTRLGMTSYLQRFLREIKQARQQRKGRATIDLTEDGFVFTQRRKPVSIKWERYRHAVGRHPCDGLGRGVFRAGGNRGDDGRDRRIHRRLLRASSRCWPRAIRARANACMRCRPSTSKRRPAGRAVDGGRLIALDAPLQAHARI